MRAADSNSLPNSVFSVIGVNICVIVLGSLSNHNLFRMLSAMTLDPKRLFMSFGNWKGVLSPSSTFLNKSRDIVSLNYGSFEHGKRVFFGHGF